MNDRINAIRRKAMARISADVRRCITEAKASDVAELESMAKMIESHLEGVQTDARQDGGAFADDHLRNRAGHLQVQASEEGDAMPMQTTEIGSSSGIHLIGLFVKACGKVLDSTRFAASLQLHYYRSVIDEKFESGVGVGEG